MMEEAQCNQTITRWLSDPPSTVNPGNDAISVFGFDLCYWLSRYSSQISYGVQGFMLLNLHGSFKAAKIATFFMSPLIKYWITGKKKSH